VIDPFLTKNPKTPQAWKDLDKLGKIDLLLVTHAHGDHLGDAPVLATKNKAPLYGPAGLDQTLQTLGVLPPDLAPRMNKGGTITRWAPASASTWCGPSTAPSSSGTIPRPARTRRTWAESRSDS
jgi:L-ascorbate metabolism protein UlaG (beta-lactamase superfamily)